MWIIMNNIINLITMSILEFSIGITRILLLESARIKSSYIIVIIEDYKNTRVQNKNN